MCGGMTEYHYKERKYGALPEISEAYEQGYDAAYGGIAITECPYTADTLEQAWVKGFHKAGEEIKQAAVMLMGLNH